MRLRIGASLQPSKAWCATPSSLRTASQALDLLQDFIAKPFLSLEITLKALTLVMRDRPADPFGASAAGPDPIRCDGAGLQAAPDLATAS